MTGSQKALNQVLQKREIPSTAIATGLWLILLTNKCCNRIKVAFMVIMVSLFFASCSKEQMMDPVQIDEVDLLFVQNGIYEGEYTDPKSEGYAKVQAAVFQHRIVSLQIIDRQCSPVGKKGEYVVNNILKAQSVKVDAISGATTTSTIVMKATELALKKGIDHE